MSKDIVEIIERFPDILEYKNYGLHFVDDLKFIHELPLKVIRMPTSFNVTPLTFNSYYDHNYVFIFNLRLSFISNSDCNKLFISKNILLSYENCMKLYNSGILIDNYDRDVIIRKWTINNIIS